MSQSLPRPYALIGATCVALVALSSNAATGEGATPDRLPAPVLRADSFRHYVERFNADDDESYKNSIPNNRAWSFLADNIPLFECPDKELELTYYFRWWTYRKHLRQTPDGWVVTEFLPNVSWGRKGNTINMPAGLHLAEGRWLRDAKYLDDYTRFWLKGGGEPTLYTTWLAHAIWDRAAVTGDTDLAVGLLDELIAYHRVWEEGKAGTPTPPWDKVGLRPNGLFFTYDDRDGGELSLGEHGYRPLINSAMYGDMIAIATIAEKAARKDVAAEYRGKAAKLKQLVQTQLWDKDRQFFMILPPEGKPPRPVRELYGYAPWLFHLPDPGYEIAWKQVSDPQGFQAPYGLTFPEQRHPSFGITYTGRECRWNGPSWPLATSITLAAMINLLNDYKQTEVGSREFYDAFISYARSHRRVREDGRIVPWIDENVNPYTGDWIARSILLKSEKNTVPERGKDYNHSSFNDLVISGLVGLRPSHGDEVVINPLMPYRVCDWFCLDRVRYHGHDLTIVWDRHGTKYGLGPGFHLFVDGHRAGYADGLRRMTGKLSKAATTESRVP